MIRSGQKSVTVAGTAEQVSTDESVRVYIVRANPNNTGDVYLGNDGTPDVSATTGLILRKEDPPIYMHCKLSQLYVDAANSGDKITWMWVSIE